MIGKTVTMLARSSQCNLERVMAVPGIGTQVMSFLPIPDRIHLRRTCRAFLSAIDESFHDATELFIDYLGGGDWRPGKAELSWLLSKCPELRVFSLASRADHEAPWSVRDRHELWWPLLGHARVPEGVIPIQLLAERCRGLRYLNLTGCKDVTCAILIALSRSCKELEALDVPNCNVADEGIQAVAESCRGLRRLTVSNIYWVTDASLRALGQHCPGLKELEAGSSNVTDEGVTALVQGCQRLVHLTVSCVTDVGITQVAERCPNLERLGVWSCSVTDAGIRSIAMGCPRLTRLDARECDRVTDEGICVLAEACPRLTWANLCGTGVGGRGVRGLAQRCAGLEHVDVTWSRDVDDAALLELATGCAGLQHLCVSQCPLVTGEGIRGVAERCPSLRELILSDSGVRGEAWMRCVGENCVDLSRLEMANCTMDSTEGSAAGAALAALAQRCPKLEYLDATGTGCITRESITALGRYSSNLKVLKAGRNKVGDKDLSGFIKERGGQLWDLDVSATLITERTVVLVADRCSQLRFLMAPDPCIPDHVRAIITEKMKELQTLSYSFTAPVEGGATLWPV